MASLLGLSLALAIVGGTDVKSMQGEWTIVKYIDQGVEADAKKLATIHLRVKGERSTFQRGEVTLHGRYVLDEGSKPKGMDIYLDDGPNKGKRMLAIYKIEGDDLMICHGPPDGARPTKFESKPETGIVLEYWKRKKDQ